MSTDLAMQPVTAEANEVDVTLFIACYNEEANILKAIANVVSAVNEVGCTYDIVIVDDTSKDRSVELIKGYMQEHPEVPIKLIVNESNQGLGSNYAEAAFHGRGRYYRLICGDDEERRESMVAVFKHLGEADMILSYHGDTTQRSFSRRVISRSFTTLVNLISGYKVKYYNGLAVHRRYNAMRWHSHAHGFGFQADMITRLLDMGATYVEVSVVPKERTEGETKAFTFRNVCSVAHTLLEIFVRRVAKVLYPRNFAKLAGVPTVYESRAFREAGKPQPK
jgi:glycosyltransferase involved in cell wall biosynthesis